MSITSSRAKAVARTAGSATLALAAFAAVATAGGHKSTETQPAALVSSLTAIAAAEPVAAKVPAVASAPAARPALELARPAVAAPVPAPMPAPLLPAPAPPPPPAPPAYADNLDGWIHQALDIMHHRGIPGSYEGIYRNVVRESSGNPSAINLYDSNAAMGIPSKGLLQVIDPTFRSYHVDGTSWDIWNPVSNIVAACNYAAARYGSMDNVDSAY